MNKVLSVAYCEECSSVTPIKKVQADPPRIPGLEYCTHCKGAYDPSGKPLRVYSDGIEQPAFFDERFVQFSASGEWQQFRLVTSRSQLTTQGKYL